MTSKFQQKFFADVLSNCLQCVILEVVRNHREIIMNKIKIFSQRLLWREIYKTTVYEDGSWEFKSDKRAT